MNSIHYIYYTSFQPLTFNQTRMRKKAHVHYTADAKRIEEDGRGREATYETHGKAKKPTM